MKPLMGKTLHWIETVLKLWLRCCVQTLKEVFTLDLIALILVYAIIGTQAYLWCYVYSTSFPPRYLCTNNVMCYIYIQRSSTVLVIIVNIYGAVMLQSYIACCSLYSIYIAWMASHAYGSCMLCTCMHSQIQDELQTPRLLCLPPFCAGLLPLRSTWNMVTMAVNYVH